MGVYNPFAELPNSCVLCDSRQRCLLPNLNKHGLSVYRHPDCPLVEVKAPHGDLIDRDELIRKARVIHSYDGDGFEFECMGVLDGTLVDAPTVIEAEGKDDGT